MQKQQLDLDTQRVTTARDLAGKAVDLMRPNADPAVRVMLMQTLLPEILQLGQIPGLALAFPSPADPPAPAGAMQVQTP